MSKHPNRNASLRTIAVTWAAGTVVAWLNSRWGWHISKDRAIEVVLAAPSVLVPIRLWLGTNPLLPTLRGVWGRYVTGERGATIAELVQEPKLAGKKKPAAQKPAPKKP